MLRHRQTVDELLSSLSALEADWRDAMSAIVLQVLGELHAVDSFPPEALSKLYTRCLELAVASGQKRKLGHDAFILICRTVLGRSKDEFDIELKDAFNGQQRGLRAVEERPDAYFQTIDSMGVGEALVVSMNMPVTWLSVLEERLRSGRGSSIKGQTRGRGLEDSVEEVVRRVFGEKYATRCSFTGLHESTSSAKCDFAIPSAAYPDVIIEVKGYGATGSKQTDVLGDVQKIVREKAPSTLLLLVTDGVTWVARKSDLGKLVEMQQRDEIYRIYTKSMFDELENDLRRRKDESEL